MTPDQRWTPRATRGTYPKGDRRKAEIIRAALTAFSEGGFRNASMVQIASACGVSRAGLLHHFPTKESLLAAVLEERDRINGELFFQGSDPRTDGADYLQRLLRLLEHNTSQPEIVRLFATLSTEASDPSHPAHDYFADRYIWLRADLADALTDLHERGALREDVTLHGLEAELVALIDGLQIQWLLDPHSVDMPARLRARLDQLLSHPIPN